MLERKCKCEEVGFISYQCFNKSSAIKSFNSNKWVTTYNDPKNNKVVDILTPADLCNGYNFFFILEMQCRSSPFIISYFLKASKPISLHSRMISPFQSLHVSLGQRPAEHEFHLFAPFFGALIFQLQQTLFTTCQLFPLFLLDSVSITSIFLFLPLPQTVIRRLYSSSWYYFLDRCNKYVKQNLWMIKKIGSSNSCGAESAENGNTRCSFSLPDRLTECLGARKSLTLSVGVYFKQWQVRGRGAVCVNWSARLIKNIYPI